MGWKDWPYWLKGGIIAIPLSILIIPITFLLALYLGAGEDIAWYLVPEFFGAAMTLGMRGTPAGISETIIIIVFALIIFLSRIFLIGAIIGKTYGYFSKKNKGKLFLLCLLILGIIFLFFISHRTKLTYSLYSSFDSPEQCTKITNRFVENFDLNRCYKDIAVKNKDVKICDNIVSASSIEKNPEDYRWFCYEEVAHATRDTSICELIPEETYNEHGVQTLRRDRCFVWFKVCSRIRDSGWRDNCFESKASIENDPSFCENITENSYYKDSCFSRFKMCDRIKKEDIKQYCLTH